MKQRSCEWLGMLGYSIQAYLAKKRERLSDGVAWDERTWTQHKTCQCPRAKNMNFIKFGSTLSLVDWLCRSCKNRETLGYTDIHYSIYFSYFLSFAAFYLFFGVSQAYWMILLLLLQPLKSLFIFELGPRVQASPKYFTMMPWFPMNCWPYWLVSKSRYPLVN